MLKQIILYFSFFLFLTSCDCYQVVNGVVLDKDTKNPLQGIIVSNKNKEWNKTTTDSLGHFKLSNISGGFCCPPMEILIEHSYYKTQETKIQSGGYSEIQLEKKYKERTYRKDISDPTNKLSNKIETLELQYIVWGCACANWVETSKYAEYGKNGNLSKKTIFLEPENEELILPEKFNPFKNKVIVVGQFYIKPDYPKGTPESEEKLEKAPVFRYTEMKIEKL
ncbi:MAG: carboxypeptidase-like regulatory domain-containing protein [Flavobacteriales bacterium]